MPDVLSPRAILERLVAFPTVSRDSNLPLIDWVEGYLAGHGITAQRVPNEAGDKAALFAQGGTAAEGGVLLSGHTDVVPVDGQPWSTDPFVLTEVEGRLYGRGSVDMKGFDALAIWACVEAQRRGTARPVQLALSYDEEVGCIGAAPMAQRMAAELPRAAAAIVGEPSEMLCVTGHKGGFGFDVDVRGVEVHSSLMHTGVSAVMEAARLIDWANLWNDRLAAEEPEGMAALFEPPWTTLHVGMIEGGTAHNITAGHCHFVLTFRPVPGNGVEVWEPRVQEAVRKQEAAMRSVHPDARIDLARRYDLPPLAPEEDGAAERFVRQITGDNGTHVVSYGTEAGHFQAAGYSTVVCGPGKIDRAHKADEYIEIAELEAGQAFLERVLDRLA